MSTHKFFPIGSEDQFNEALEYLAAKVGDLLTAVSDERLPVPILKLFAHDTQEYQKILAFVNSHGTKAAVSSSMSHYVNVTSGLTVAGTRIKLLGVRKPDATRPQVGCGDYEVDDFDAFAKKILVEQPQYAGAVQNAHGSHMIELKHPDFDVIGYVIPGGRYS